MLLGAFVGFPVGAPPAPHGPVHEIEVVASKFAFEPPTIEVTAGESVRLVVRSADTVHGFAIRKLNLELPIPSRGQSATLEFTAPQPGRFEITCSEFCGSGHRRMKAALVSVAPAGSTR